MKRLAAKNELSDNNFLDTWENSKSIRDTIIENIHNELEDYWKSQNVDENVREFNTRVDKEVTIRLVDWALDEVEENLKK